MAAGFKAVIEAGETAPWMVMVHGMSQDHRVFSEQVSGFKDRYRILLIDLPGHGLSADIPGPFGHHEMAAAVGAAMKEAGVEQSVYWATHTGTSLGLLLTAAEPERFQALVLEGAVLPGHAMPSVDAELDRSRANAREQGMAAALQVWFEQSAWFDVMRTRPEECRSAAHREIVDGFHGANWLYEGAAAPVEPIDDRLAEMDLPVLVYNGAKDLPDFLRAADRLETLLPRATRATVPEAGGSPAWEFPDRVNHLVADFLAEALGDV